jgi:HSP20 family protein
MIGRLVHWDPFSDLDTPFSRMMPRLLGSWPRLASELEGDERFGWSPSADISETDKEYLIRAELPAVKKEDVHVTVDGDMIRLEGERKQHKEDKNEKFHRIERVYGKFTRSFSLPQNVDAKHITCESNDGVVTVHIPKTATEKHKPIEVKVQ